MTIWVDDDNCGTCKYLVSNDRFSGVCSIRNVDIESLNWTYCINIPKYNVDGVTVALGPVYEYVPDHSQRKVIIDSPDTQEVRDSLLFESNKISEVMDYHSIDLLRDEVIVWQLGEFKEQRSILLLKRIEKFNQEVTVSPPAEEANCTRKPLIKAATLALDKISGKESISTGNRDTGDFY